MISRRKLLIGGGALGAAGAAGYFLTRKKPVPIGFEVDRQQLSEARALLSANPAFDMHAHPGRTFVRGATGLSSKMKLYKAMGSFEKRAIRDMQAGGMSGASFATVSDFHVLNLGDRGLYARRDFAPGEAWGSFITQMGHMRNLVDQGLVMECSTPADLQKARASNQIGAWFTAEGGDFLQGSAERVEEAYALGLRSVTIMHYRNSELGDIMTAQAVSHGLTTAGKSVITAMDRLGMIVDVAHASESTVRGVLAATNQPVICSHTHIKGPNVPNVSRFISRELADEIVANGGIIGAWPAGIGISTLNGLIDRVFDLVEQVGVDYVALGTDMDANYKPVMDNYRQMPLLVAGLKARGMHEDEIIKIIGGNFIRLWNVVTGSQA